MGGERAGLMNTDPPYGVDYAKLKKGMPGFTSLDRDGPIENDELTDGPALQAFLESVIRVAVPHLTERPAFYLWHPMLTQGTFFAAAAAAAAADILIHRQIIWVKPQMVLTRSGMYHWKHELCFYGWIRGKQPPWYGDKCQVSVWELGETTRDRVHPTQKPVALFAPPMTNHTHEGDLCYEPFSGSGSQIIAGTQLNRRVFAMEVAPAYVDVCVARWEKFTGRKAELAK
jgi:DNA modification methylase